MLHSVKETRANKRLLARVSLAVLRLLARVSLAVFLCRVT